MPTPRAAIPIALKTLTALTLLAALALLIYAAIPNPAGAQTITDYDTDDNGLIEISNLDQLNAVRYDLNGDGIVAAANTTTYAAAFPNHDDSTSTPMGCPAACTGYELMQNLNFTHDSSGATITNPYPNWSSIGGTYTAQFHGNGRTISNLTITGSGANAGLFNTLGNGGGIRDLGLINPSVSGITLVGALVSQISVGGEVSASYVTGGTIASRNENTFAGGLVGENFGTIRASYAYATVTGVSGGDVQYLGVLVGANDSAGIIIASYAVGSASGGIGLSYRGGLVGRNSATVQDSYCDSSLFTPCIGNPSSTAQDRTTTQLQTPTGYTGIYALWNVDGSGDTFPDQPWDFGTTSTYPVLKSPAQRTADVTAAAQDYDQDDDNLIDITTQAQLAAIDHDLNGDGLPEAAGDYAAYAAADAFIGGDLAATATRMGCPSGCQGYELMANLVMSTTTNWTPIGSPNGYAAQFHGNGHTITNLTVSGATFAGLFHALASGGAAIRDVGIIDPNISGTFSVGGLVATINPGSEVTGSYVTGGTVTFTGSGSFRNVGGLVAWHQGAVRASYASTTVSAGAIANVNVGGLVANARGGSAITASYANGPVAGTGGGANVGGLVGSAQANAAIADSYCDATVFGTTTNPCLGAGTATIAGYTTAQLQEPTGYTGIYENWNISLDADLFPDNPWNFGATTTYPTHTTIAQRQAVTDYDSDNDNLIEINTLHQLNAIRHDLNGDGLPNATGSYAAYANAFPGGDLATATPAAPRMGCPATCTGYELTANLDFDTNNDGSVTDADDYPNWNPIGGDYTATFNGNGHTIANLTITNTGGHIGLFSILDGSSARIEELGLIDPVVSGGGSYGGVGVLVGRMQNGATIELSYARGGTARTTQSDSHLGGLVGANNASHIRRSYATVAVTAQHNQGTIGGLVGVSHQALIRYSWSAGAVNGNSQFSSGVDFDAGGLVGRVTGSGSTINNNFCDTEGSGKTDCIGDTGNIGTTVVTVDGHNTAAFQTPVVYSGIFASWNWDLNGDDFPDDPWNFGSTTTYPTLKTPMERENAPVIDYDTDNDNLIDIRNLDQLNAIRHDLDGNGLPAATSSYVAYAGAFPRGHLSDTTTPYMGCAATCIGYELMQNLDFAADNTAVTTTDPYPNWNPIGSTANPYAAQFHGNAHTITRLTIDTTGHAGLFDTLGSGGVIRDVGMLDASITGRGSRTGILAAANYGEIRASYALRGAVTAAGSLSFHAGGLVGQNSGVIRAAYATASVDAGTQASIDAGGLVGINFDGAITAGYAVGPVAGAGAGANIGGLAGRAAGPDAAITDSYCDTQTTGQTDCIGAHTGGASTTTNIAPGQTTAQLQTPTGYTGIYAHWRVDADGDTFPDDAWNFGATTTYPTLKTPMQRDNAPVIDYDQDNDNLIDINTLHQLNAIRHDLDGNGLPASAADYPAYASAFPNGDLATTTPAQPRMGCPQTCTGYELMQSLDFAADGSAVTTTDAYPNWTPIGGSYTGDFNGKGHTITRLTITGANANAGLFDTIGNGGEIRDVGMLNASITTSAASAKAGILAAIIADGGAVTTSYIQNGSITVSGDSAVAGGLAGQIAGEIRAAYTTASVSAGATAGVSIGGLAGQIAAGEVTASYAAGPVSGTGSNANLGGFAGAVTGTSMITDSYCDTAPCQPDGATATSTPQASGALQWTDGYNGIFANWNLDLNDDNTPDYPWYFGGPTDYPVLNTPTQRQAQRTAAVTTTVDYDANNNGLIDIDSLTKLNAIRHDLDGNGLPNTPNDYAAYLTAFPNGALDPTIRMGCPAGNCTGYELTANLDFDTDNSGSVGPGDTYPNWTPIGNNANPYTAAFNGNARSIANLTITSDSNAGLFGALGDGGIIRDLTIRTPNIRGETAAALAAVMTAGSTISTSYVQGGAITLTTQGDIGGLAGQLSGAIRASHASTTAISGAQTGSNIGGLVGSIQATGEIIASYAAAPVTGAANANIGGLAGQTQAGATITNSYCDAAVSGAARVVGNDPTSAECHPTGALQSPTGYSGLYAAWNLDLNGDNTPDYPWYFGTSAEYPQLNTPTQRTEQRTSGDVPPPPLPRAIIPEPPKPYDPAADHPEIYTNAEYQITATCQTRNPDPETNEPREATITFNLGTYNGPILLALSIWTGSRYMAYETQNIPEPTLQRQGQTATLNIETNPAQTRFRLDGTRNGLRANLVLGYADCRTN